MSDEFQQFTLTTPEDVYGALRKIALMGAPIQVTIDASQDKYKSALTLADFKNRSFFIDQVVPREGNDSIRGGQRFSIECDAQGVRIAFQVSGRIMYQPQKEQYRIEFPEEVLYLQRRTAYRVQIPPAHDILIKLKMNDEEGDLMGKLEDISSSGFKAHFSGLLKKRIDEQRDFPIARIRFNRENTMDCSLEARHVLINERQDCTLVGFAFTSISAQAQRYIDRLIHEFQWEEKRLKEQEKQELSS